MLNDFISGAKGLTRNPLGIIALFVSLIYGFACLVLSTSISNLHAESERLPLIWFIILFPLVILGGFIFLVVKHHEKLYAPSDFRGDDSFIQTIDRSKIKEKKLEEVKTLESAADDNISEEKNTATEKPTEEIKNNDTTQDPKIPIENELLSIYTKAETWAANELSLKYNIPFQRNVSLSAHVGKFELDAFANGPNATYIAEIKYWQANKSNKKLKLSLQDFFTKHVVLEKTLKRPNKEFKIIIALVYDSLKTVNKIELIEFAQNIYKDSIVEFFDFNDLKDNYE